MAVRHTRVVSGTATILLHGAAGSWTTWLPAIEAAGGAEATDDLVMPDLPGWGESPADPSRLDPESLARAVAAVARALGYRRWRVLGHSMGGFVALELAVLEPEATVSVLLVSATTLGGRGDRLGRLGLVGAAPPLALMLAGMRLLAATGAAAAPFVRWLDRRGLLGLLLAPLFDGRQPAAVHELARDLRPTARWRVCAAIPPPSAGRRSGAPSWRCTAITTCSRRRRTTCASPASSRGSVRSPSRPPVTSATWSDRASSPVSSGRGRFEA